MAFYIDQSGEVVESDATPELASFNGYAPASPEQVEAARANAARQAEFGTVGQQVVTGVEGALRGGTFGGSDYLLTKTGIAEPERMAARREVNAPLATATEVGGALLPIAFSGGTGALGSAARLAPTAALSRGAAALGERAAAGLAARPVLQGAVQAGLSEAVEGAVYGAGEVLTEYSLGRPEMTAERAISTIGLSSLLGGGGGALFGGAAVAIPKALRKAKESTDEAVKRLAEWYPTSKFVAEAGASPADAALLIEKADDLNRGVKVEDVIGATRPVPAEPAPFVKGVAPELPTMAPTAPIADPEAVAKGLTESIDQVQQDMRKLQTKFNRTQRMEEVAQNIDQNVPIEDARKVAQRLVDDADAFVAASRAEGPERFDQAVVRDVIKIRDGLRRDAGLPPAGYEEALRKAQSSGLGRPGPTFTPPEMLPSEVYAAINEKKQLLQDIHADVRRSASLGGDRKTQITAQEMGPFVGSFKNALTDATAWGTAATRQSQINDAFTDFIAAEKNMRKAFMVKRSAPGKPDQFVPNPEASLDFVKSVDRPSQELRKQALDEYLAAARKLQDEIATTARAVGGEVDEAAMRAPLESIEASSASALERRAAEDAAMRAKGEYRIAKQDYQQETLPAFRAEEAARREAASAEAKAYKEQVAARKAEIKEAVRSLKNGGRWNGFMDIIGAGAVGSNPMLAPLFVAYRAGKYLSSPDRTARVIGMLRDASNRAERYIDGAARAIVAGERSTRQVIPVLSAELVGDIDWKEAAAAPEVLADKINESIGDAEAHAPDVAAAMALTTGRAVSFLASKAPQPPPRLPLDTSEWKPSPAALSQFNRYIEATNSALFPLHAAMRGTLAPEHVEALNAVYPEVAEDIRVAMVGSLTEAMANGKRIPYRQQQTVGMLLGQDLTGAMPTLAANQAAYEANPAPAAPVPPRSSTERSTRMMTPLQQAEVA